MPLPTNLQSYTDTWLKHIRYLAEEIGSRGPTTVGERKGAEYCQRELEGLGLAARIERFRSARSIFTPHLIASILLLISFIIYPLAGISSALLAALIATLALASDLLELAFYPNLIRWLVSKGDSQNVVAVLPPAGEAERDLVLIGHIDSQRTPLIFKTPAWLAAYKTFTTIAFVAFSIQVGLYWLGTITGWGWIWLASIPCAVCAILLAAMCIQADLTPFTAGANDNASAVGLVLTLGEYYKNNPLDKTRLWLVCTGCEEVQHYGAIDFFKKHHTELHKPRVLVLEMLGCAGPAWLTKEGIIIPFHASPEMVRLAKEVANQHPDLGAYPVIINGGNTEMADALRLHIPAITLTGMTPDGGAPYWHMVGDTFDKIDPQALHNNLRFARYVIQMIDEG